MKQSKKAMSAGAKSRLAELVRTGVLKPAKVVGEGPPPRIPILSLEDVLRDMDQCRAE